ncbi:hypothetical protein JY651_08710 [Pyxidicoccus parkwayensis]|uniref:Outer membrane protein beta-barrel domain-containing protein n=1 Tax=Pyxidicoccus parkwayensis TaxID=2813578 RepID=A0ABX7P3F8_9BACT|nr:hypothetical protein [Pyxidicoccus parkwaysis]QSQ24995.1 hypothetical protein JY651_08710 [Pyxidicoccus parkwaysis]
MKTWLARCLLGGLVLSASSAFAQDDDDPYAYPDEEKPRSKDDDEYEGRKKKNVDETDDFRRVAEQEGEDGDFKALSGMDDPNTGLAFELISGALLVNSSRGQFAETRLGLGLRATWEYGRILDSEPLREALWADLRWTMGSLSDGTDFISADTRIHYFTIAPAYELKLGQSDFGFYAQVGGGVAYQSASLTVDSEVTKVNGIKPLLQGGVGFRGRPRISSTSNMRLAFRIEALAYRRSYMTDFFLGGSLGTAF